MARMRSFGQSSLIGLAIAAATALTTPRGASRCYFVGASGDHFVTPVTSVPEPSTWAMMLLGFCGLGFAFRHSRRKLLFA